MILTIFSLTAGENYWNVEGAARFNYTSIARDAIEETREGEAIPNRAKSYSENFFRNSR